MTRSKVNTQVDNGLDETNKSRQVDVTSSPGYRIESSSQQTFTTENEEINQYNAESNTINSPHQVNVAPSPGNWIEKPHGIKASV